MRHWLIISIAALFAAEHAGAQIERRPWPMVSIGSQVRVTVAERVVRSPTEPPSPSQQLRGIVRAIAPESLYLELSNARALVAIPRIAIQAVQRSAGPATRSESAMAAGTVGLVIGALFLPSYVPEPERRFGSSFRPYAAGAGIGFAAGALLGALRPYERWRGVWIPE